MTENDYQDFTALLEPQSAFLTELRADTLWGMMAWAALFLDGEAALKDFLTLHEDGSPRLLITDAFPNGYLPRPLQPVTVKDVAQLFADLGLADGSPTYLAMTARAKKWLERSFLEEAHVRELLAGNTTPVKLLGEYLYGSQADKSAVERVAFRHNVIDRQRGGALRENGLYTHAQLWFQGEQRLYLRTTLPVERVRAWLEWVGTNGFGKRASTGLGRFEVKEFRSLESEEVFAVVDGADGFLTLSSCYVPGPGESVTEGHYHVRVKRGKLGSAMPTRGQAGFLKRPVTVFQAGSIFPTAEPARRWFGRLLDDVHPDPQMSKIKDYGFTFAVAGKLFGASRPAPIS